MSLLSIFKRITPTAPAIRNEYNYVYAPLNKTICNYCGSKATAYDHVLPISIARLLPYFKFSNELLTLVPCCTRCNSIAGNRFFTSISAKKRFIVARLYELKVRADHAEVLSKLEMYLAR